MEVNVHDFGTLVSIFSKHGFREVTSLSEIHKFRSGVYVVTVFFSRKTQPNPTIADARGSVKGQ
jgi:hypothetical protein